MKQYRFLLKNFLWILLLSPLLWGCEESLKGGEKILGTAIINGHNYKEATVWAWNFQGYPTSVELNKNYKLFSFHARLSPEKKDDPSYTIYFYVSVDDFQFKTNHPYLIDFDKEWNMESLYWGDVIPYFSKNLSEILAANADGIAYAVSSVSGRRIPLKGEFVLENINPQTDVCHGHYSFSSSENDPEKMAINGKFEAKTSIADFAYPQ